MTKMTLALCLLLAAARPRDPVLPREPDPSYKLIPAPGNTYGYDIYVDGRRLIHQTTIPGLPGVRGFARKKDAEKIAVLVIQKLQQHILPPAVSRREMDSLQIKY